jgi:hypothetical protein
MPLTGAFLLISRRRFTASNHVIRLATALKSRAA